MLSLEEQMRYLVDKEQCVVMHRRPQPDESAAHHGIVGHETMEHARPLDRQAHHVFVGEPEHGKHEREHDHVPAELATEDLEKSVRVFDVWLHDSLL